MSLGNHPTALGGGVGPANRSGSSGFVIPSSATTGLQIYNTADQTTNYERLEALWSSNVATIRTAAAGTGIGRTLRLQSTNATSAAIDLNNASTGPSGQVNLRGFSSSATNAVAVGITGFTSTATSGTIAGGISLTPTYNQASGTAANTDILLNRTQTAVGSGAQLLMDLQVGGVSMFSVSNTGTVTYAGAAISPTQAISAEEIDWALSNVFSKTLGANTTFTFANSADGQTIIVALTNTASNYTVAWPSVQWSGGVAPTMTVGAKTDVYTFVKVGSDIFGSAVQDCS